MTDLDDLDAYITHVAELQAEIERLTKQCEDYSYSELDMDMHVEAVTKELHAEIERLRAQLARYEPLRMDTLR